MQGLTRSLDFQAQALTLRAERQRLLASNIANADTPGYVAREMDFARALREATAATASADAAAGLARPNAATAAASSGPGHALWAPGGLAQASAGGLAATHAAHFQQAGEASASELGSSTPLVYARPAQDAVDRNTVDLDRERASFADNSVRYEAALRFLNGQIKTLTDAMRSPSQG